MENTSTDQALVPYITKENSALVIKKAFSYLEANEEKRRKYQEIIKDIPIESIIYIDESGIDWSCSTFV